MSLTEQPSQEALIKFYTENKGERNHLANIIMDMAHVTAFDMGRWLDSLTNHTSSSASHSIDIKVTKAVTRLLRNYQAKVAIGDLLIHDVWVKVNERCRPLIKSDGMLLEPSWVLHLIGDNRTLANCAQREKHFMDWHQAPTADFSINYNAEQCLAIKEAARAVKENEGIWHPLHISDLKEWLRKLNNEEHEAVLNEISDKADVNHARILLMFHDEDAIPHAARIRMLETMSAIYRREKNMQQPLIIGKTAPFGRLPDDVEKILKQYDITWLSVSGAKGAGKDTFSNMLANILYSNTSNRVIEYKWAEPLKAAVSLLFGWSRKDLEDYDFKETVCPRWNVKPRDMLKNISEEFLKKQDPYFVLKYAANYIADKLKGITTDGPVFIVISDTRFDLEIGFLRSFQLWNNHQLTTYRINRDEADTTDTHVSEVRLPDHLINHEINNNFNLDALKRRAEDEVHRLANPPVQETSAIEFDCKGVALVQQAIRDKIHSLEASVGDDPRLSTEQRIERSNQKKQYEDLLAGIN